MLGSPKGARALRPVEVGALIALFVIFAARMGLGAQTDPGELERWCREAIAANPKSAADYRGGKESAINAFKGPVMRAAKGRADPRRVDETLRRLLAG